MQYSSKLLAAMVILAIALFITIIIKQREIANLKDKLQSNKSKVSLCATIKDKAGKAFLDTLDKLTACNVNKKIVIDELKVCKEQIAAMIFKVPPQCHGDHCPNLPKRRK